MQDFFRDVAHQIEGYYKALVAITPKFLLAVAVILISWIIASRVRAFADVRLKKRMKDTLLASFIANLIKAVLIIIGVLIMCRIIGLNGVAKSLLAGAGISAFIIGFALKDIGENFLAGILLAFKRPFTVGDIIESNGVKGKVVMLNLRDTQIRSDGKDIFIPNALLIKNTLMNYNRGGRLLQEFTIGLEYGSDYNRAMELIREILTDDEQVTDNNYQNTAVVSNVTGLVVQLNIRYWVKTSGLSTDGKIRSGIIVKIMEALKKEGIVLK
ncbi:MAG: mechanosensitive ion channel protein MscS [Crocinitomicaceae bacterium]|jgi:small-conductance mechanosensitive channel|nr:mechanosensitive ion channel protein MscS [Crocinitomicaceae bacterium]